jgi:hypothetical protein
VLRARSSFLMRYILAIAILMIVSMSYSRMVHAQSIADCPLGMEAYWRLEESTDGPFEDFYGANEAAYVGANPPQYVSNGHIGGARQFIRANATGIDAPGSSFNWGHEDSFSIEFWMKKDTPCSDSNEVIVGRDSPTNPLHWWVGVNCSSPGSDGLPTFVLTANDGTVFGMTGSKILTDAKWHHIVAVRDAATERILLYVDGKLDPENPSDAQFPSGAGFSASDAELNMGWLNYASGTYFYYSGILDEVAVYNRAITLNEVRAHYFLAKSYCQGCSTIKIMPVGDSITAGMNSGADNDSNISDSSNWASYRKSLWFSLLNHGYDVDFVGSQTGGEGIVPSFDVDHEGHGGWTAYEVAHGNASDLAAHSIGDWLNSAQPDVVLLHIGTNGLQTSIADVESILNAIDAYDEDVTVVLALIINRSCSVTSCVEAAITSTFNDNLEALASRRIATGDKIIVVDMESKLNYSLQSAGGDMYDDLHPYANGYTKMAAAWLASLESFLPGCLPTEPVITSEAQTNAYANEHYTYTVTASGFPAPAFALIQSPQGMTIDAATGTISWTPDALGVFPVVVLAANSGGSDTQSFSIFVGAEWRCPESMISHWKFDEDGTTTFEDSLGTHDGTCSGQCPDAVVGLIEGGQRFDGSTTGINVPANSVFDWAADGSFSIEYWMKKSTSCTGNEVIIGRDALDSEAGNQLHWWSGCSSDGTAVFELKATNGEEYFLQSRPQVTVTDGMWHHIAVVRDYNNSETRLYVDGTLEDRAESSTYSAGFGSSSAGLNIGWLNLDAGYRYDGILDEMAIYGRSLADSEVQEHYDFGLVSVGYCYGPPVILENPVDQTVSQGQTATFGVVVASAIPEPYLTYQWTRDGSIIFGANSSSYTTSATTAADNGATVRCVVTTVAGIVTSNSATLTVIGPPTITTHPLDQSVRIGQAATFTILASGSSLAYQWTRNGINISGANGTSYTTSATTAEDHGATFRCAVSSSAGSATSNSATLHILPVMVGQPSKVKALLGTQATFSVTAVGGQPLSYQWQRNGVNIAGANSSSYTAESLRFSDDRAMFRCVVSNSVGSATSDEAILIVGDPDLTIIIQPESRAVIERRSTRFRVKAKGPRGVKLAYQWYKNGVALDSANSTQLTCRNVRIEDNGAIFSCIVSNPKGGSAESDNASLYVNARKSRK